MGHPFYLINQLNGVQVNALYFPNHGFTKEALNQAGKFIQLIHKGDAPENPYTQLMTSCYQLSKGVYQDDQEAEGFINKQGLPKETQRQLTYYFLMEQNLISELLGYSRPTLTINWKVKANGSIDFENSTLDIDGLLTKTPSQNPNQTIAPDDYTNPIYYQEIMDYLAKPKTIQTNNIPLNQHLFIMGRLQPAWYDPDENMIYEII